MTPTLCFSRCTVVGLFLALAPHFGANAQEQPPQTEIVLLNWSDYIDPELVQEFETKYTTRVKEIYFESEEERDRLLIEGDGKGYDLALVTGNRMKLYRQRGWIDPLDEQAIPNLKHVDPRWTNAYEAAVGFGVPYFWGTTGIAYRSDLVPEKITSWKTFFRPPEALRGKIGMMSDATEVVGMALKALGYPYNSADPAHLDAAEKLLLAQKPYVLRYAYVALSEDSALVTGEIVAAMAYNGDSLTVAEHDPNITFVAPREGVALWVDYLTVLASSSRKDLARTFINFLNEPENAARLAQSVYFATPNVAAEKLLPAEFLGDPVIYPPQDVLERSEFESDTLAPRAEKRRNAIMDALLR